jgi:hypothetical protein
MNIDSIMHADIDQFELNFIREALIDSIPEAAFDRRSSILVDA